MKTVFYILLSLFLYSYSYAQAPNIEWAKCYGGSDMELSYTILATRDGGYAFSGSTKSSNGDVTVAHGEEDFWIVKLFSSGVIDWQKTYGGSGKDECYNMLETEDGGYLLVGESKSVNGDVTGSMGNGDGWMVKINAVGDIEWQKTYGGINYDKITSIKQTLDGGYVFIGSTWSHVDPFLGNHGRSDVWIGKISSSGELQWQRTFGGTKDDEGSSIIVTTDGGYLFTSYVLSSDGDVLGYNMGKDGWVVKLSSAGDIVWKKAIGSSSTDLAVSALQTEDGGFVVLSYGDYSGHASIGVSYNTLFRATKISSSGNIEWDRIYNGRVGDWAHAIQKCVEGGYIISGNGYIAGTPNGFVDYKILKISQSGFLQWTKNIGGSYVDGWNVDIKQTQDGGYIIAGTTWCNDDTVTDNHGSGDIRIVKLEKPMPLPSLVSEVQPPFYISVTPNPTTGIIQVSGIPTGTVSVYNVLGCQVASAHVGSVSLSNCNPGMYFVKIHDEHGRVVYNGTVIKE